MSVSTRRKFVPGEAGIWGFLLCDLIVFSLYFVTFLYERAQRPEEFAQGADHLNITFGLINTLVLLTSSLFVALAVQSIRKGKAIAGRNYIAAAAMGGLVFIGNKCIEWMSKVGEGYTPTSDVFFQLYYMMTGLHFLHVIVGIFVLILLWRMAGHIRGPINARQTRFLENGAIYWHLVDLIWLVLFALFYLVK